MLNYYRYQRSFNKKSGIWSVHELKVDKTYSYIPFLVGKIIKRRLDDEEGMSGNVVSKKSTKDSGPHSSSPQLNNLWKRGSLDLMIQTKHWTIHGTLEQILLYNTVNAECLNTSFYKSKSSSPLYYIQYIYKLEDCQIIIQFFKLYWLLCCICQFKT